MTSRRLLAVLAHPDDESLGFGGTLAKYAGEGVEVFLLTATCGEKGRYRGHPPGDERHPGSAALAALRENELRAAAAALGIRDVMLLDYHDGEVDRADPVKAAARIARHIRHVKPDVIVTFGPDGAYGHPDHIAVSQFTTAAIVAAADPEASLAPAAPAHAVSKLYHLAMPRARWDAYQEAFKKLVSIVDGVERQAVPWPDWEITTVIDTRDVWPTVWKAVSCHATQIAGYERLRELAPEHHEALWGSQSYYRVFSTVNGGRAREIDLFDGLREMHGVPQKEQA